MLIQITKQCFEGCTHCMVDGTPNGIHMNENTFKKAVQFAVDNQVNAINISGGDPFLHPDFYGYLNYLHKKCRNYLHAISIESNGWWIENKIQCDKIIGMLDKYDDIFCIQVSTNKKYYPNYEWIMNHKGDFERLHSKIKFTHDWQGTDTPLRRLGRAKNIMTKGEVKGLPGCMNYVSYALQRNQLGINTGNVIKKLIQFGLLRGKTCVPYIQYDGKIKLSESIDCVGLMNINDYFNKDKFNKELLDKITSFIPCNKCNCMKNMDNSTKEILDELRSNWKLDPVFKNFN